MNRQFYPIETGISFLQYRIPHGVLGWSLEPGGSYVNVTQETEVLAQYNSNGWRDAEYDIGNQEGKFWILVLGDSYMEAYSVGLKDTFFQQLEKLSQNRGLDIKTINYNDPLRRKKSRIWSTWPDTSSIICNAPGIH